MNEIIFQNLDHDIVAFDGHTLSFATGEDTFLFLILFLVAAFFIFIIVGNFFQSLLEKYNIFSGKIQSYLPFFCVFLLLLFSFVFIQKKVILPRVNVPISERQNLLTITVPEKKVTVKEKNKIVDTYTFSQSDYFYLMILDGNKSTSYSLLLMHNGKQKEVVYSDHFKDITAVQKRLIELGFPVKVSP